VRNVRFAAAVVVALVGLVAFMPAVILCAVSDALSGAANGCVQFACWLVGVRYKEPKA
jgi:hypothetical protein